MVNRFRMILLAGAMLCIKPALGSAASEQAAAAGLRAHGAFADAALVPADVTLYVHVEDAAGLHRELSRRPIAEWLRSFADDFVARRAWQQLARAGGVDEAELFEALLGRSVTLVARGDAERPLREWTLITEPDPEKSQAILARMRPKLLGPRGEFRVVELPEHELLVAAGTRRLVIAPTGERDLFDQTLTRLSDDTRQAVGDLAAGSLLGVDELSALAGDGANGILVRHAEPLGGWSCVTFDGPKAGRLRAHVAGRYASAPIARPLTQTRWSPIGVGAFEGAAVAAVAEPTDVGRTAFEVFLEAALQLPRSSRDLNAVLGPTRVIAVGEVEGRMEQPAVDLPVPGIAVVLEVTDRGRAAQALDEQMTRLAARIESLGEGTFALPEPNWAMDASGGVRRIDLQPAIAALAEGWPLVRGVSLVWTTASIAAGPAGPESLAEPIGERNYCIVASHPSWLTETVKALERSGTRTQGSESDNGAGLWASCGFVDGMRLGRQLEGLAEQPGLNALATEPADRAVIRQSLDRLARLGWGVERVRWRLSRPTEREIVAELEIELAGDASSQPNE